MTKDNSKAKTEEKPRRNFKVLGIALVILGIGIILYLAFFGLGSNTRDDNASLTDINNEAKENPVVLYFWADGCPPCAEQKPIIKDLEDEYKGNVTFYWFNYGNHGDLTSHYKILGTPTTIVINQSEKARKFTGLYDEDEIASAIDDALKTYN
jgi:thioredoxin 1